MARKNDAPSERTRLRRLNQRGKYDAAAVHAVLDAMPLCHVGYIRDGATAVTPTSPSISSPVGPSLPSMSGGDPTPVPGVGPFGRE